MKKNSVVILFLLASSLLNIVLLTKVCDIKRYEPIEIKTDTIIRDTIFNIKKDTIFVSKPRFVSKTIIDTIWLKECAREADFALKTQIMYNDTNYTAWISGVEPNLDSIRVYNTIKTNTINKTINHYIRQGGLFLDAGIGLDSKKQALLNVGFSYITAKNYKFGGELGVINNKPYMGLKIGYRIK